MECEDEGEDHNWWQMPDKILDVLLETEQAQCAIEHAEVAREEEEETMPNEEDNIKLEEWSQLGYKWFKKDETIYF